MTITIIIVVLIQAAVPVEDVSLGEVVGVGEPVGNGVGLGVGLGVGAGVWTGVAVGAAVGTGVGVAARALTVTETGVELTDAPPLSVT